MIRKTVEGREFESQMVGELHFDQTPKEGSFNPVTSDAVVKAIGEAKEDMQEKIDEVTLDPSAVALGNVHLLDEVTEFPADGCILIDSETNGPGEMSKDTLLELTAQNSGRVNMFYGIPFYTEHVGYLNKNDGTITPTATYHCLVTPAINVEEGQVFTYRGIGRSGAASAVFYDSAGAFLSSWQANPVGDNALRESKCTIPVGAKTAVFSSFTEVDKPIHFYVYLDGCPFSVESEYDKKQRVISGQIKEMSYVGYMLSDGSIAQVAGYKCVFTELIPVEYGQVFMYKGRASGSACSWVFFDSGLSVVSSGQTNSLDTYKRVQIPSGVAYAIFSSMIELAIEDNFVFSLLFTETPKFYEFAKNNYNSVFSGCNKIFSHVGYMQSDFTFATNATYHCTYTDYIAVKEGQVFLYKGIARSAAMSAIFFDKQFYVVGTAQENNPGDFTEITIPSGAVYAVFSSFTEASKDIVFELKVKGSPAAAPAPEPGSSDVLKDKVWYACGDSFTHGDFTGVTTPTIQDGKYIGELAVYPYLIGNRTLCDVHNIAVNGSTLAQPSDPSFVNAFTHAVTGLLYTTDFSDADLITLYFGINDSHKNIPIGTINDNDNTTFYGAWNVALDYLTTNYPSAKIGIIVSNGCDTADYPTATEAIAKKWGCAYLDLDGGVGCQTMLRCSSRNPASAAIKARRYDQQMVSATNGHPNALAHELESTFIEGWLKSL